MFDIFGSAKPVVGHAFSFLPWRPGATLCDAHPPIFGHSCEMSVTNSCAGSWLNQEKKI